jgi:hypothetical protein
MAQSAHATIGASWFDGCFKASVYGFLATASFVIAFWFDIVGA